MERGISKNDLIVQPSGEAWTRLAVGMIAAASLDSIAQRGVFNVALAGGSTPAPVYAQLAASSDIDWKRWRLFWSDERCVPPGRRDSNYRMAQESLLDQLPVLPQAVVRMKGEIAPEEAARAYEREIRNALPANGSGVPRFDLILLGLGDDGHTASLFPGSSALDRVDRLVVCDRVEKLGSPRLTFTFPLLNAARYLIVLVQGSAKSEILRDVLQGPARPATFPIQGVRPSAGRLKILADTEAASLLTTP